MKSQTKSTNMQCNVKKTNHKKDHAFSLFKYIYIYIFMLNIMQKKQEKRKENLIIIKLLYVYIVTQ